MRHRRGIRKWHSHNIIFIIIIVVLVIGFAGMLAYSHIESKKKAEELRKLAQVEREKEEIQKEELKIRYKAVQDAIDEYLPGIVCWGDSLTMGAGSDDGTTYPNVLAELIKENVTDKFDLNEIYNFTETIIVEKIPVVNMGVGGETTHTILGRNGAIPFVVSEKFTIPADILPVEISIESESGKSVAPLRQGSAGMEYVIIDGIKGVISIKQKDYTSTNYKYYFTREAAGDDVTIKKDTKIVTAGSKSYLNYIPVIFIGQNGGYDNITELIEQQRAIVNHQNGNPKGRFIIIGLHTGTSDERAKLEKAMADQYGNQYINLREYMSTRGLNDADIDATEEDLEMMESGMTPSSLLYDHVNFNATGYDLIGKLIYKRMDELGYFDEVQGAIEDAIKFLE